MIEKFWNSTLTSVIFISYLNFEDSRQDLEYKAFVLMEMIF